MTERTKTIRSSRSAEPVVPMPSPYRHGPTGHPVDIFFPYRLGSKGAKCRRERRVIYALTVLLLLSLIAISSQAQAGTMGETSVFVAVDPFHGDNEIGAFLEYRREKFQIHAGCFNPCAAGIEYLWRSPKDNIEIFLGLAALDGVNHVNGTKINISGGFSARLSERLSFQFRHYSNGARWHSPISDDEAPNKGWNFIGLKVEF